MKVFHFLGGEKLNNLRLFGVGKYHKMQTYSHVSSDEFSK